MCNERSSYAKQVRIGKILSQQADEGYWISKRITDPRSSNVDGTAFVLVDLLTVPELSSDHKVSHGLVHLISNQNPDGGWSDLKGELSRPTITSYVLWALGNSDLRGRQEVEQGVCWLEGGQYKDGGWAEIVERPWEGGIRPGETQPWITASCMRGLNSCPQADKDVISRALVFLEKTQRKDGSWEGRMGTDMVLLAFREMGLTIERDIVRRSLDYELSFQREDGFLPDAWGGETLLHMVKGLYTFLKLGLSLEDERISKIVTYLKSREKNLTEQLYIYADLEIFEILEDLSKKYTISLLS